MKLHAVRQLPGSSPVAICWQKKATFAATEAEVTCKECLRALAAKRETAAILAQRRPAGSCTGCGFKTDRLSGRNLCQSCQDHYDEEHEPEASQKPAGGVQ